MGQPALLTRTKTVMHRRPTEHPDRVLFRQDLDEPDHVVSGTSFPLAVWIDMGSPDAISVTIEPGDLLND